MPESKEVQGIIGHLLKKGIPARVTATWDDPALGIHSPTSYHYAQGTGALGLAVDFGSIPPGDTAQLRRIYNAFVGMPVAELLGPGDPGHSDHVHVAVRKGTFLSIEETPVPDDPNLPNIRGPVSLHPVVDASGKCWGYYIFSSVTGELHAHGDPEKVKYWGRSEVL